MTPPPAFHVYSRAGADRRFGPALPGLLPRPAASSTCTVGFIGDSWMTPMAGGPQGAPAAATMVAVAAARLGVGAAAGAEIALKTQPERP